MSRPPRFRICSQLLGFDVRWATSVAWEMRKIEREGAGPGSLTSDGLRYHVLDGIGVRLHVPELWDWAATYAVPTASALAGRPLRLLQHAEAAVNVNMLEGQGEQYELHTDSCPYTLLVFASGPHEGGELFCQMEDYEIRVKPRPGLAVLIAGNRIPHAVLPLRHDVARFSVPIAFEPLGEKSDRDPALSQFLYA